MNPKVNSVGNSGWQGFKPAGEKHVNIPSDEGKIRYQIVGKGIDRPTFILIFPNELPAKIKKYRQFKQRLEGPGIKFKNSAKHTQDPEETEEVELSEIKPESIEKKIGARAKPVVCQSTGKFYTSTVAADKATRISCTLIGYACNGKLNAAKGHFFRWATEQEIQERRFIGEIIPAVRPRQRVKRNG